MIMFGINLNVGVFKLIMSNNRQLRNMLFVLYPDNESHCFAVDNLKNMHNSLCIKHNEVHIDDIGVEHKAHWHCILWFENGTWVSTVCKELGLSDQDYHLFRSIRDKQFKRFKTVDDYIIYLTHIYEDSKPDKYEINDFFGGRVDYAKEVLSRVDKNTYELFLELARFVRQYNIDHIFETRTWSFTDWYELCCQEGYGLLFFQNWYKMRDILRPYINVI